MKKLLPGIIPLFILIAIGVVLAGAGGVYVVRKEFIKRGQSGKAALDEKKIQQQLKNPVSLEAPSPEPTPQLAPTQYTYEPAETSGSEDEQEPKFTINPPSGWSQKSSADIKVGFVAPEQDEEPAEPPLVYQYSASVQVAIRKLPEGATLAQAVDATIDWYKSQSTNVQIISKNAATFAGQEAQSIELLVDYEYGVKLRVINYIMIKNGYVVGAAGLALDSAWSKRAGTIQASVNSFRFTD